MIYVKLHGRTGNHLFQIAAAATLAKKNNVDFTIVCHKDYTLRNNDVTYTIWDYTRKFTDTIYKNITILENPPNGLHEQIYKNFHHVKISYKKNILLNGAFQSYKYFDEDVSQSIFHIPNYVKKNINSKIGELLKSQPVSVHVRRGDYCEIPHKHPVISKKYIEDSMERMGKHRNFIFISDDLEWCKKNFSSKNHYFLESNDILTDLFAQSFCFDNIISNSSFGWWGAFLNKNKKKKVIYPTPWFGNSKDTKYHNTSDLCPPNWIPIKNKMSWNYRFKALRLIFLEKMVEIKNNIRMLINLLFSNQS